MPTQLLDERFYLLEPSSFMVACRKLCERRFLLTASRRWAYNPERKLTLSDGSDNRESLADADLVSITGSAFCTGTLDGLLDAARNCRTVIVQGQSAALLPEVLFERGVSLVSTSVKPANLLALAVEDPTQFKSLLEGRLPKIYSTPLS